MFNLFFLLLNLSVQFLWLLILLTGWYRGGRLPILFILIKLATLDHILNLWVIWINIYLFDRLNFFRFNKINMTNGQGLYRLFLYILNRLNGGYTFETIQITKCSKITELDAYFSIRLRHGADLLISTLSFIWVYVFL